MTGASHKLSGLICAGAATYTAMTAYAMSLADTASIALPLYIGATAPDWMECPVGRLRWVPHRTLTHWWGTWATIAAVAFFYLETSLAVPILFFCVGSLVHISGDAVTPMGVPWLTPMRRKPVGFAANGIGAEIRWLFLVSAIAAAPVLWIIATRV